MRVQAMAGTSRRTLSPAKALLLLLQCMKPLLGHIAGERESRRFLYASQENADILREFSDLTASPFSA
jgi:hypothetical protein